MSDLVSIIMPSYNTGQYIEDSINSVLSQTYTNWELIIVDDYSTDNTNEIIQKYRTDPRIKYYRNNINKGAALSRNHALKEARGRWIAFLDSDDLWMPDKLKKQISFMENNNYSFSYTAYSEIDEGGNITGTIVRGPKKITKRDFYNYCWPGCLTVMYDADAIGLIQIADIKKNNDYAMWLNASQNADCYFLDEELALYRRGRTGSVSNHSIMTMIGWHYKLHREADDQNAIVAMLNTVRNLIFGLYKKIKYVKSL